MLKSDDSHHQRADEAQGDEMHAAASADLPVRRSSQAQPWRAADWAIELVPAPPSATALLALRPVILIRQLGECMTGVLWMITTLVGVQAELRRGGGWSWRPCKKYRSASLRMRSARRVGPAVKDVIIALSIVYTPRTARIDRSSTSCRPAPPCRRAADSASGMPPGLAP
jgi:hypothetical protein